MPTPPPELFHLQTLFYDAITARHPQSIEDLNRQMQSEESLSFEQGLSAYQGSLIGKLSRALEEIYPVCCQLVGEAFFGAMARRYIRQNPSRSPNLGDYGSKLPKFISDFEPAASLPYLPDVAQLEWHWHRVFNGKDQPGLDITALEQVPPEDWGTLIFKLPKHSVLLSSKYPIHRIWQAHQAHQGDPEPINLAEGGVNMLIWRDHTETRIDLPTQEEWMFLQVLASGENFGEICEALTNTTPTIDVATLFPLWVQRGWIKSFTIDSKKSL